MSGIISFIKRTKNRGLLNILKIIDLKVIKKIDRLFVKTFSIFKTDEKCIVLESQGDYTDNIKVFYDYMVKNKLNDDYKLIWIVHNPKNYEPVSNVKFVSRFHYGIHVKLDYYIATAKFIVFSHPYWLTSWKDDQVVIHTTHSAFQLKGTDTRGKETMKIFDYVLCCSPYVRDIRMKNLSVKFEQMLVIGMPRIDLVFQHKNCLGTLIREYAEEKVILSMETYKQANSWNDSGSVDCFALNVVHTIEELKLLDSYLGRKGCKLIVKIHHLQNLSFLKMVELSNIKYLTDYDLFKENILVNELLENADILITDYSSVFYEYLLLDRPIGFLIGDFEDYSRGFLMEDPLKEMPGEKIRTLDGLLSFIDNCLLGCDLYVEERTIIRNKVFKYQDNQNCERLFKWINNYSNEGKCKL